MEITVSDALKANNISLPKYLSQIHCISCYGSGL